VKRLVFAVVFVGICLALGAQAPLPSTASFDVGFSPGGSALAVVEKAIDSARTEILMACYEFTERDIAEALDNAARRGVKVRIVADWKASHDVYSQIAILKAAGVPVRLDERYAIHHNKFMVIDGVTLDLSKVTIPIYEIAAKEDHIAPARSVFLGAKLFGGPVEYVLGGAGHVAGIINPPDKGKYQYWRGGPPQGELEDWIKRAEEVKGSWWPHWIEWLKRQAPAMAPARHPGVTGGLEAICDAPGKYVRMKA